MAHPFKTTDPINRWLSHISVVHTGHVYFNLVYSLKICSVLIRFSESKQLHIFPELLKTNLPPPLHMF